MENIKELRKERFKNLRKELNKTQKDMADYLKISQASYQNYETGISEPSIDNLCKLADMFDVSLDYLVGRNFGNRIGFLTENQITFVQSFLALNKDNQVNAVIYVANLLANQ